MKVKASHEGTESHPISHDLLHVDLVGRCGVVVVAVLLVEVVEVVVRLR